MPKAIWQRVCAACYSREPGPGGILCPWCRHDIESRNPEQWRPVVGYEGLYVVSNRGNVHSVAIRRGSPRSLLKPWPGTGGYLKVGLHLEGKRTARFVHQLVLEAFTGLCPPGCEARHGPLGKLVNTPYNLCWGTPAENARDKERDGTAPIGEAHGNAKLTVAIVRECRVRYAAGETVSALAEEFGIHPAAMRHVLNRERWRHVP